MKKIEKINCLNYELRNEYRLEFIAKNMNKSITWISKYLQINWHTAKKLRDKVLNNCLIISHKNKGNQHHRKISTNRIDELINEYLTFIDDVYDRKCDCSVSLIFFYDYCLKDFGKNNMTYRLFIKNLVAKGFYSKNMTKKTKKKARENLRKLKENNGDVIAIKRLIKYNETMETTMFKARKCRDNNLDFGEIVELDACEHRWMNGEKSNIYVAVDSSTSRVLAVHIEQEETNLCYMKLLEDLFRNYGKPKIIRTDKRRTFWGTDYSDTPLKQYLNSKGIELQSSSIAIFKPHVERANNSLQQFLPPYLHLKKIKTFEDFIHNKEEIIQAYNKRNKKDYEHKKNIFSKMDESQCSVYLTIKRKIYASTVQFQNKFYVAVNEENKRQFISPDDDAAFIIKSDGSLCFLINQKEYKTEILKDKELNDFQQFCIHFKFDSSQSYSKEIYQWSKRGYSFYRMLDDLVFKLKEALIKFDPDDETLKNIVVQNDEILEFFHKWLLEIESKNLDVI
ncbi:hypothetical protein [Mycoplasmopsis adleri]|uniref:hypothetical protein n=1 Tax=Mycoplasmopsis adleri TaxID=51362 RepID=UPI00387363C5